MIRLLATALALAACTAAHAGGPIFIADDEAGGAPSMKVAKSGYVKRGAMTAADYPEEAVKREQTGRVRVSFVIGGDGRASECLVERSSGVALLDHRTCTIVEKRYVVEPPRDADGNALRGRVHQWVTWQLAG